MYPAHDRIKAIVRILAAGTLLLLSLVGVAAAAPLPPDYWPTAGWRASLPEAHGLDGAGLQHLAALIREGEQFPGLHSLLVVRNGYLVAEEYFGGYHVDRPHTMQSVSKSFTSAAIGIAIADGTITGVDEPVLGFFPDQTGIANVDDRKRAMVLEDLLTMRSGTDYHERGPDSPHYQLNELPGGWTEFVLDRPMVTDPGTVFQYDSGGVILMSALIRERTGAHADVLLEERLFAPLGIKGAFWTKNQEGHPHLGGGLVLRPRDMAKFGLLYLQGGRWEDKQIVPADWVATSTRRHVTFEDTSGEMIGYGYLWWILKPDPEGGGESEIYAASGFMGQYIFVVPEHDMVVVVTGGTRNRDDQYRPVRFLYSHILAAVMVKN